MFAYDLLTLALALRAGLAGGFLNTAASSGSAVSLPALILLSRAPASANTTNRIPVLIGAITPTASFRAKKALPWHLALLVSRPAALGSPAGAGLAEALPSRDLGLVITAARPCAAGWHVSRRAAHSQGRRGPGAVRRTAIALGYNVTQGVVGGEPVGGDVAGEP